jgi:hypothetical protein
MRKETRTFFVALLLTLSLEAYCEEQRLAALEPISPAESGNPLPARDDEWRFTIAFPMIWTPNINGKIRGDEPIDFTISFKDILDNLSFGMMFELYANRGPYGLAFRSNFMRVEDESSSSGLLNTRINTSLDMGVNDLLASFRVHDKLRLVTGVRHVLAKLDAEIGVAGDNDRDFSTEFRALYRLGDLNNFWFGYRYLNIGNDSTEGGITYEVDMSQQGPTIGWAFTF